MSKVKNDKNGLPKGWEWKTLSDICIINPPKSEAKGRDIDVSFVPMADLNENQMFFHPRQIKKLQEVYSGYTYFKDKDVLLAKVTPCFENGKSGIAKELINGVGFGSSEYIVLRPKDALPEYIYHIISNPSFLKEGAENMSGAVGLQRVTKDFIHNYKIPLPPLPEQQRIVQQLDTLFQRIDKAMQLTRENLEHCTHLLPAALNEVFGEMSKSKVKSEKLKSVTTKIGSGSTPSGGQRAYKASGISLIRSMNVYDEGFEMDGLAYINDEQASKLSNVIVEPNDVLLNITGASVARCCIVPEHVLPARVNQHVSILRFKKNLIHPEFAHYFFISPDTKFKLLKDSGGGATREAITKAMLEDFEIRFPDIKRQQQIITYLNQLSSKQQQLQQHYTKQFQQLQQLKASLLDGAFKGEL